MNEMYKTFCNFEVQTDHRISARRLDLESTRERERERERESDHLVDFAVSLDHRVKIKESKKITKFFDRKF